MDNFLFTKEEATKLFDDNISVRENKELLKKADARMGYVVETMSAIIGRNWAWFDFDNENSYDSGNPVRGYFDKDIYSNSIDLVGQYSVIKNPDFDKYERSFPTNWLWTNFEVELKKEVDEFEAEHKAVEQKRLDAKNHLQNIRNNSKDLQEKLYDKIPSEMRNNFSFKSAEQIHKERLDKDNTDLQEAKRLLKEQEDYLRQILTAEEFEIIQFKRPEDLVQRMHSKSKKHKR